MPFWSFWSKNLGTSKQEKYKKLVSKRANQWCNRYVSILKHINLEELQRSVSMITCHFLVILAQNLATSPLKFDLKSMRL